MRTYGAVTLVESSGDRRAFEDWLSTQHTVAVDTETTGLNIYSSDHKLRLVAFANPVEAWVLPEHLFRITHLCPERLVMHNASYDIQVFVRHYPSLVKSEALFRRTTDTRILAHLIDPRGREEGGTGHSLGELAGHYLHEPKLEDALKAEFKRLKLTPYSSAYATIPWDNEVYVRYAGVDAILTARLYRSLEPLSRPYSKLVAFEHKIAMIASLMDAQGFLLDVDYTEQLSETLLNKEAFWKSQAKVLGLENINSVAQVADVLGKWGITAPTTGKGNPSVDGKFLEEILNNYHYHPQAQRICKAVVEGKKAGKWRKTWVEKFLNERDSADRVHPSTNTLRARTARFSITGIPAQTLPSGDSLVRSCFVANTGQRIVAVDYANQELRYAAALSADPRMVRAFRNGEDLHLVTAEAAWPGRGEEMRKLGKGGNFGTVYGGGVQALMSQFKMTEDQAKLVRNAIRTTYPTMHAYSRSVADQAAKDGYVMTMTGRKLPVDANRAYSAFNYRIQSGCRDITAQGLVNLYDAGYIESMRLAIHDEVVFSLPGDADVSEVERLMSTRVGPVELPAGAKIGERSWGSLYQESGSA